MEDAKQNNNPEFMGPVSFEYGNKAVCWIKWSASEAWEACVDLPLTQWFPKCGAGAGWGQKNPEQPATSKMLLHHSTLH